MRVNKLKGNISLVYPLTLVVLISLGILTVLIWWNIVSIKYNWQYNLYLLNDSLVKNISNGYLLSSKLDSLNTVYYITNNVNVKKVCTDSLKEGCWPVKSSFLDGTPAILNGAGYILPNGIMASVIQVKDQGCDTNNGPCAIINFDLNGISPPNEFGKDEFRFYIYRDRILFYLPSDDKQVGTLAKEFGGIR